MNMIRYKQLPSARYGRVFDLLRQEMEGAFNPLGGLPTTGANDDESGSAVADWCPAVDIRETDDAYLLAVDVPGVDPNDIELTLDKGVLSIRGERQRDESLASDGYKRVERVRGTFFRRFSLPDSANADEVSASGANGVLEVRIAKREQAQPRRIAVNG